MKNVSKFILPIISIMIFSSLFHFAMSKSLPDNVAKIADDIYSFSPGDHYHSMFIVTSEGVIAIESVNSVHAKAMLKAIKEVTDQPVKYLLHSHNHWDHSSGGQVFKDAGAITIAHVEAYEWMKANPGRDMAVPDESWSGMRKDIILGGTTIELHYLGMNHGLGMTIFLIPKQKVAYIADLITPKRMLMSIVPDFNIKEWERSIKEIIEMDWDNAVYTHNEKEEPINGGNKQDARDVLQFIQDLRTAVSAEFQKGTNPMKVADIVKLPKYRDWHMYDQWLPMNVWRMLLDEWMGPFPWRPAPVYQDD